MLAKEFEDVGAHKVLIVSYRDTKHIDDSDGIMLDSKVAISDDEILGG